MSGDINIVIIIELSNSLAFFITLFEYLRNLN
ncbi:HAD family hydrolase, partial [Bacteroides intestinalis]